MSTIRLGLALVFVMVLGWGAPASAQEMTWTIHVLNAKEVELSGDIGKGMAADLAQVLVANPTLRTVHVNLGRGGYVKEAIALSDVIFRHRMDTYVPRVCGPACSIVVSGGLRRYVLDGVLVGYSNYSSDQGTLSAARWQSLYKTRFSIDFISKAVAARPNRPWVPTQQELLSGGAVTGIVNGAAFAKSSITTSAADIEEELLSQRVFRLIKAREPERFVALVGSLEQSVAGGMPTAKITPVAGRWVYRYSKRYMVYADDLAIHAYVQNQLAKLEAVAAKDTAACFAFVGGSDDKALARAAALIPASLDGQERELLADILESADPTRAPPDPARAKSLADQVVAAMGDDGPLLEQTAKPETAPEIGCRVWLHYYRVRAALPPQDSAILVKSEIAY